MAKLGEVASAMANAPLSHPEPTKTPERKASQPLPTATFAMVANAKFYEDRNDKSKQNGRIAHVYLRQGAFTFEASIYLEIKVEQRADGRHETKDLRFSLPKGVKIADDVDPGKFNEWKDTIVRQFAAWRKETGGSIIGARTAQAGVLRLEE